MFHQQGPHGDRRSVSRANGLFIQLYLSESPKKPSHENGEVIRSPSTEPHADGMPTYSGVRLGSPRGQFSTLLSLTQCHAAFGTIKVMLYKANVAVRSEANTKHRNTVHNVECFTVKPACSQSSRQASIICGNNAKPLNTLWAWQLSRYSDWLRAGRSWDRSPVWARFSAPVQTGPGAHPAPCTMGTGSFAGVEAAGVWGWPPTPSNVEVLERVELYLYSP